MFESPASHQAGLTFYYRGPEWAIAVRQGDMEALAWAMERCSQFWNGASTLIIPVRSDGRIGADIGSHLDTRPVEACFLHDSVTPAARASLARKLGPARVRHWASAWDGFDENEMHPLLLQPVPSERLQRRSLRIPRFDSERMRLISLATWGHVADEDLPVYRGYFDAGDVRSQLQAHSAMLAGQLNGTSPAEQSLSLIGSYGSMPVGRALYVFGRGSFEELVRFWNLRRRSRDARNRPMLFGVARESLEEPETLRSLAQFIASDNFYAQKPDLGLLADDKKLARRALEALGFEADPGSHVSRSIGGGRENRPLSFGFFGAMGGGPLKRGAVVHEQVTITSSETSFRPPRPAELPQSGHYIRVGIEGLPLPMPLTDPSAAAIFSNAYRSREGLTVKTDTWFGQGYIRLVRPDAWDALGSWAAARGETVKLSPPGGYGQALLDRLGDLRALEALAGAPSLAVLSALSPISRPKLAQKVVKEATKQTGTVLSEQVLADLLAQEANFLELRARSASEIAGEAMMARGELLPALGSLVEAGFVVRGAAIRCPRCKIGAVLLLSEQSERVRCRACNHKHLLPVLEEGEKIERPVVYQLDGLMARAMDQDLLPVLLTLRACLPTDAATIRAAWLGLEFESGSGKESEHDLLVSDGATVTVGECKATASISDKQLRDLLKFAAAHEALPVLGALAGSFSYEQRQAIEEAGGSVFERAQLLAK